MARKSLLSVPAPTAIGPAQRMKLLARVAAFYHRAFMERAGRVGALTALRGIRDAALFKTFQVGLADGTLLEVLPQDAATRAELQGLGVLTESGAERFAGCLVFPLWSAEGSVVNLCGRPLGEGQEEEIALAGLPQGLWNMQASKRSAAILLTESILDALGAVDRGFTEAMPGLGEAALSDEQLRLFAQCGVKRVAIACRADEAAEHRASAIGEQLRGNGIAAATLRLPAGTCLSAFLTGPDAETARASLHEKLAEAFAGLATASGESAAVSVAGERIERTAHGFKLTLHDRAYEVKGIARETTQLKATIKACSDPAKGFELTTLDLYSSRSREAYAKACAALFGAPDTVIRADLARLLERIETWRPEGESAEVPRSAPEDEARGLAFLQNPNIFGELLADLRALGIAGEETNKLACYLACVSRKLDDPLSLLIQSRSAAGKSTLQHAVLALTPEEDQVHYTRLTSQALYYQEERRLAHKVLALEETQGLGEAAYSLRALQSAKRLTLATTTKDPLSGRLRTEHYVVQGPVAVLLTTSSVTLDEETASRFLTLAIDESPAMTETILANQRHRDTLAGYLAELDRGAVIAKHHAAQRLLEPLVVINPYAEQLAFPAYSLRARRDHKKYLMLVNAVAFLFQKQRAVKEAERGGKHFRYIEVAREDIRRANALASGILAHSVDELSAPARTLLGGIHAMVKAHCAAHDIAPGEFVFTRRDIRAATGWSDWQVRTHARELEELEYLKARSGAWGREYVYALAWQGDGGAERPLALALTDPDTLLEAS